MSRIRFFPAFALAALMASPAFAHLDPLEHGSLAAGLSHPIFGADHVIAMIAVGLWAATLAGRALWALPCAFVGGMLLGFGISLAGLTMPMVEPLILASVIVLGVAVAFSLKLNLGVAVGLVGLFGLMHGNAHGAELGVAGAAPFALGFVVATMALHGVGVGIGLLLGRSPVIAKALGGLAAVAGVGLAIG